MALHRGLDAGDPRAAAALCRGPGNLCRALAITRGFNFVDLTVHPSLWIERMAVGSRAAAPGGGLSPGIEASAVRKGPRIGVASAGETWAGAPLRWFVAGHPSVSGRRGGKVRGAGRPRAGAG